MAQESKSRLTLDMAESKHREIKHLATDAGLSMRALIEQWIDAGIAAEKERAKCKEKESSTG